MTTAATNYDRVTQGIRLLQSALAPFVSRELQARLGKDWWKRGVYYGVSDQTRAGLPKDGDEHDLAKLDVAALLSIVDRAWSDVFYFKLTKDDRTYVKELQSTRNKWAHHGGGDMTENDAWRALDTVSRLLLHVHPETGQKTEALANAVRQPVPQPTPVPPTAPSPKPKEPPKEQPVPALAAVPVPPAPKVKATQDALGLGMKPWREVARPHDDVASGRYHQAEFAADLAQVLAGKAEPEYQDPGEFFARTYVTEGMKLLLSAAVQRLTGTGGEPVVQLKTAFGGGKTHTMLALYHLTRLGPRAGDFEGIETVLSHAGVEAAKLPKATVAVLVGTALDPTAERLDAAGKGVTVHTLWGELAAQLGGATAYDLVKEADRSGVSPGADTLVRLFERFGPAVVLVDELVAYARNIYGVEGLPGGSFDSTMTFVQSLTEAARRAPRCMVVASIPESDVEIGGDAGKAAQARMEQTFGRLEAVWKPVGALEGFEIVRRRLFAEVIDPEARDVACRQFARLYGGVSGDFPGEAREVGYLDRLRSAYPIHPEVFDRLYDDWSTLERFQRTRGVLRLMASVIHALWVGNDKSVMILPGNLPLDNANVRNELTRYLPDGWAAVIDRDVDGDRSEPYRIDAANPRYGQLAAARRIARAIFLGTAPHVAQQRVRGIESAKIRLGVAQPNESIPVFNDALGQMVDRLTYLYSGDGRYWYDTRPNLRRTAEEKASQIEAYLVTEEIQNRLKTLVKDRADFAGIHLFAEGGDVPDDPTARLVVLRPEATHRQGKTDTPALQAAWQILDKRGTSPRLMKNMLLFVAPDAGAVDGLDQAIRQYLAWEWVKKNEDQLNLDTYGRNQAIENQKRWDQTATGRLNETYVWLLTPFQDGAGPWRWEATRIGGSNPSETFVGRAARKLRSGEQLITQWSPVHVKMLLDQWFWKETGHYEVKRLWEALTNYGYLPRLANERVLRDAIAAGLRSQDYFGYAGSVSPTGRYEGLVFGEGAPTDAVLIDAVSVLVKPEVAIRQLEADERKRREDEERRRLAIEGAGGGTSGTPRRVGEDGPGRDDWPPVIQPPMIEPKPPAVLRRFYGSVSVDPQRAIRDATTVVNEVLQHLTGLTDANVTVTIEIAADLPNGAPDHVVRTVTENCRTLKFKASGFEEA
jgi:predicted AAA+ superfamily ATPase